MLQRSLQLWFLTATAVSLASGGCGQILGLGDFTEGSGGTSSTSGPTTVSSTTGSGGQGGAGGSGGSTVSTTTATGTGGSGGALCTPTGAEDCAKPGDEDCNGIACSDAIWSKSFGDPSDQQVTSSVVDKDGNIIIAGYFSGTLQIGASKLESAGGKDLFLAKLDAAGGPLWGRRYGDASNNGTSVSVAVDGVGNIFFAGALSGIADFGVCGSLSNQGQQAPRAFIAKLGPQGNCQWAQSAGNAPNAVSGQRITSIATDAQGNAIFTGIFNGSIKFGSGAGGPTYNSSQPTDYSDVFVAKLDAGGAHVWSKAWTAISGQPSNNSRSATTVAVDDGGNTYVGGNFSGTIAIEQVPLQGTSYAVFLTKLDPGGGVAWAKAFHDAQFSLAEITAIAVDASGQLAATGYVGGKVDFGGGPLDKQGLYDGFIAAFNTSDGSGNWAKRFGDPNDSSGVPDTGTGIAIDKDGNVLVTGVLYGVANFGGGVLTSAGSADIFVAKLDHGGGHLWSKIFGDLEDQGIAKISADRSTGAVIVAGSGKGTIDFGAGALNSMGGYDVVVAKFQP